MKDKVKPITKRQFIIKLESYIDKNFDGNKAAAGRHFGCSGEMIGYILNMQRNPSQKVIALLGYYRERRVVDRYLKKKDG